MDTVVGNIAETLQWSVLVDVLKESAPTSPIMIGNLNACCQRNFTVELGRLDEDRLSLSCLTFYVGRSRLPRRLKRV